MGGRLSNVSAVIKTLFVSFLIATNLAPSHAQVNNEAIDWISGTWGINPADLEGDEKRDEILKAGSCLSNPVILSVNPETGRYSVSQPKENYKQIATILATHPKFITLQYDDEERKMANGNPQIWHAFFLNENQFAWVLGEGINENERDGIVPYTRIRCHMDIS